MQKPVERVYPAALLLRTIHIRGLVFSGLSFWGSDFVNFLVNL